MIDLSKKYRTRDGREVTNLHIELGLTPYPIVGTVGCETRTWTAHGTYLEDEDESRYDLVEVPAAPGEYVKEKEFKTWQLGIIGVVGRLQTEVAKLSARFETALGSGLERVKTLTRHEERLDDLDASARVAAEHFRLIELDMQALQKRLDAQPDKVSVVLNGYSGYEERLTKLEEQLKPKAAPLPQRPGWVMPAYRLPEPGIKVLCRVFYHSSGMAYYSVLTHTGTKWETQGMAQPPPRGFKRFAPVVFDVLTWTYVEGLQ